MDSCEHFKVNLAQVGPIWRRVSSAIRANFDLSLVQHMAHASQTLPAFFSLVEPQCRVDYTLTMYRQLGDIVQLKCQVLANPLDNLQFDWQFNDTSLSPEHKTNRSSNVEHTLLDEDSLGETLLEHARKSSDKSKRKANLMHSSQSTTHSSSDQQHLISNVVRIELSKWTSFGHFSCQARNQIGLQKEACKWHIVPHHFNSHHQSGKDEHLSAGQKHRYHHRHHQQQSHHATSTLNNCQIIESSNAVVIRCRDVHDPDQKETISQDYFAHTGSDLPRDAAKFNIDRAASSSAEATDKESARGKNLSVASAASLFLIVVTHAEIPTRLTYHVQVFQLADAFARSNSSLQGSTDRNNKSPDTNGAEQHYFPQIDQPEPGKRVASKSQPISAAPQLDIVPESSLLMDTINFTNPLFIITNLSASTSYLLKIWSSKAHVDSALEQVNITVRTKPNDELYPLFTNVISSNSVSLGALLRMSNEKLLLLVGLVALISMVFVSLTFTYAIFKIRAILEVRKGKWPLRSSCD